MTAARVGRLLLTVAEAADALGVSEATAYRWIAAGVIPTVHLGRAHTKVSRAALEKLITERTECRKQATS